MIDMNFPTPKDFTKWFEYAKNESVKFLILIIVVVLGIYFRRYMNSTSNEFPYNTPIIKVTEIGNEVNSPTQKIEQNSYGPNSPNIVGNGNTVNVTSSQKISDPNIAPQLISKNVSDGDYFKTEFAFDIISEITISNIYLEVHSPTIISMEAGAQRTGGSIQGNSGTRMGYTFTNLGSSGFAVHSLGLF